MLKEGVAKKTKKQKLLAELHRLKKITESTEPSKPAVSYQPPPPNPASNYQLPETPSSAFVAPTQPKSDHSYVLSDLRQSLVLTALAICAQVVLWYVWGKR